MSIPDIFETHGEPHFRYGEARVIARLLDSGPAGAGDRRRRLHACGDPHPASATRRSRSGSRRISTCIMKRVKRRADRPLLQTADPAATVSHLIERASRSIASADVTVSRASAART